MMQAVKHPAIRFAAGIVISAAFILATLSRVDAGQVIRALQEVRPAGLVVALVLVWLEIGVRAVRWRALLAPIRRVPFTGCLAYLCIGYFANTLLPGRLGDVARAYLAGTAFGIGRLVTFGTILIERFSDGITILVIVVVSGLLVAAGDVLAASAFQLLVAGAAVAAIVATAAVLAVRTGLTETRAGTAAQKVIRPLLDGGAALRRPAGIATLLGLTLLAFGLAVVAFDATAAAVGLELTIVEAAFVMGALALSTAIPAGPGSVGTYEFVGVTVLVSLGFPAEPALASVLLVHLLAALPPSIAGLGALWAYHLRIGSLVRQSAPKPLSDTAA